MLGKSFHGDIKGEMKQFYNQRWFIDQEYLPDTFLDLSEFRNQFCASVRRHLLAEVPFGLLLSGGLGMISHKKSLITIFGHKHEISSKNLIFFMKIFNCLWILVYI